MLLLSAPFETTAAERPRPLATAVIQLGAAAIAVIGIGLTIGRLLPGAGVVGDAIAGAGVHGGLIGLGWLIATEATPGWMGPVARIAGAVLVVLIASHLGPWGVLASMLPPAVLWWEARRRAGLRMLGVCGTRLSYALAGLTAGAFLGGHLLMTAALTFGYHVQTGGVRGYLGAVTYDVGANVLSAEWLFRGVLFSLLWRRFAFWPAAALSTALAVVRYLMDPALPHSADARAGAIFYLGALGLVACGLRAWSGSLLPGYFAALAFFVAYRTLAP